MKAFFKAGVLLLMLSACKKDKEQTTAEKIAGSWKVETAVSSDTNAGVTTSVTYTGQVADYIDFRADGKVYTSVNGNKDTSTYSVSDNKITFVDIYPTPVTTVYDIKLLTSTNLQLYNKNVLSTTHYTEATANLKK